MAIEFVAFTTDHRITGQIPLADDRLTDMLNAVARIVVRGAATTDLDTGRVAPGDVLVPCSEFLAVAGTGRRGIESRRRRTLTRRVRLGLGRYVAEGLVHVVPGPTAPPIDARPADLFAGRDLLVPLTDAVLTYSCLGTPTEERWQTLLVNRSRMSWVEAAGEGPGLIDDEPSGPDARLGRTKYAKDFTGTPSR